jgi:alpha-tubulin suppressor-like RCC1 family protein
VRELARLTHANVAASVNPTGAGGDTFLEYKVGEVSSGLLANLADYERAGVSLQLEDDVPIVRWGDIETWHSEITNWTSNQKGTVTVTMAFDLRGEFYYAGDVWSTDGYVYMYHNNREVARKYFNVARDNTQFKRVTFTATFAVPVGNNKISVSPREGIPTIWSDKTLHSLWIEAPYFYGGPAAATAHTVAAGNFFEYYYYAAGTSPQTYTATGLPAGLTINSIGVISGYPRSGTAGVHVANITVSNGFGSRTLPVTFTITNQAPDFASTSAATIPGGVENAPLTISYATLAAAVGATDPNNTITAIANGSTIDPISFRIESLLDGTLTKNGTAVTAGTTSIASGESLVWTPPASVNGLRDAFTIKAYDGALYSAATKTVKVSVGAINDAPTLASFSGPVTTGTEDSPIPITFADLMAKGDEADIDSAVTGFVVKEVTSGSLKIGTSEGSATPWNASTNKVITASLIGYWTPDPNVNGPQSALKVVARDDGPLESATPVQAVVSVSPSTDVPTLTTVDIISGQTEGEPMEVSYTSIAAAADEADVDGDAISFRIEAVSSGTLQKWTGAAWAAVVPGTTLVASGEKLRWTPSVGTTGLQNAFTIKAWDGQFASATAIQLKVDAARWTIVPWTSAATSGLDSKYRYTHAYSFGASGSFALGGITFTGIAGGNPSVNGKLSTTNFGNFTTNDDNNLSDASRSLANDFVYGSSAVQTVTLQGLNPGTRYVLSLFSVGADSASRDFTLQSAMGQVAVNQNAFGNNNGIRIDYKYLADSSGSATITITPAAGSFNLYGLANRESSASATLYPPSSLTYDGSPKSFQSGIAPRNEPFVSAGVLHSVVLKSDGTVSAFGTNNDGQTNVPAGLNNVVAVSAGGYHTLALKSDGTVVAWGSNSQAQSNIPAGLSGVVAISAGKVHNLALKSDGTVVAWGSNSGGQATVPAGLNGIVAISAGASHSMALKSDGTVVAWGVGFYNYATPPADLTGVVAISAGEWHSLALKSNGTVVAWGNNGSFQSQVPAGLKGVVAISAGTSHSVAMKSDGTVVAWGDRDNYGINNIPAGLAEVVAIDAGSEHTIAIKADGTVVSFGWFRYGQQFLPATLNSLVAVSTGTNHTLALKKDGTVLAWGGNTYGQTNVPAGLSGVVAVQAGDDLSVALKSDGTVVAWGAYQSDLPAGLAGVSKISASRDHVLALKTNGTVVAWGDNSQGQCNVPAGLTNVVAVAAGGLGSVALKSDGTVVYWGNEMNGRGAIPAGLSGVTAISAGWDFCLALKSDGTVASWGNTSNNGSGWAANMPAGLTGVVAIQAGFSHALALKSDGSVVGWGTISDIPATTRGAGVISLAAGLNSSIALKSDGTIIAWGNNNSGQLSSASATQFPAVGLPGRSYTFNAAYTYSYQGRGATTYATSATAPTNAGDYTVIAVGNGATITQNFTINKVTPSVAYINRVNSITYGTALNSNHVDSSSSYWWSQGNYTTIPGSKVYSPAIGAILPVGTHTLGVTFLPTDSVNFNPAVATSTITVSKAAVSSQNITLPSLTDLTFNGLSKNHAATAAGVSGFTYTYTGRAGTSYGPSTVAPTYAGSYTVTASINDANYSGAKSLDFAIAKATPAITTNPTASAISFGQSLASSSFSSGAASVPGVFAFNTPSTTPSAGTSNHTVTFTPADTVNFNPVSCTVGVTTNPVALNSSNIAFTVPANLVYSGTQKTFTASASGISTGFTYSYSGIGGTNYGPTPTPPSNAGNYAVTATVTNANYTGSATQTFTITKATPTITWATPGGISYGTALSASQLNATASVAGSFVYSPASGTTLATGARTLQASFTPTDTANYNSATASVPLLISSSSRPISLIAPPSLTYDGAAKSYAVSQMSHIAAGWGHSLAIKADGTVVAWGSNSDGQTNVPANLSGVIQVAAGFYHSVALKADGTLVGWGKNDTNQRANIQGTFAPYTGYSSSPNPPYFVLDPPAPAITNGIAVAGGGRLSVVLKADGTVAAIGKKDSGSDMPTTQNHALTVPAGLTGVTAVAAGWDHALALKSDGTVVAWDGNQYGESTVPDGLSGVVAIAAGQDHSIALKSDGTVVAWGRNNLGQCTVPSSVTNVVAIASGDYESYALKKDGSVVYWGSFGSNQVVTSGSGVIAISAGAGHLLMLRSDGSLVGWGDNNSGQTSIPVAVATSVGNFAYSYSYAGRAGTTYAASSTAPTNAGHYTLTVTSTDPNFSGSKTVDFTIAKATPTLTSLPVAAIITEGQVLSAATLNGGSASVNGTFAFSSPSYVPEAGASTQSLTFTPTDSVNYNTFTTSITVLVQGANAATPTINSAPSASAITLGQQLGSSTLSGGSASVPGTFVFSSRFASPNPGPASQSVTFIPTDIANYKALTFLVPVTVFDGIVSPLNIGLTPPPSLSYNGKEKAFRVSRSALVSAGSYGHVLVVKSDGTVSATGDNSAGQTNVPAGLTGVVAVAAGSGSSMALKSDGTVVEWGASWMGSAPSGLTGVVAIARGTDHALALKSNGTVVAWGHNAEGQTNVPASLANVVGITASGSTSYALKSDGTVVAWGGQPTIPDGLSGIIAINASSIGGVVALKADGTVVAWGFEAPPEGLSDVMAVAAGRNHRVALKSDGTVVAWGSGTTFTPTGSNSNLVPWNLTDVVAIAASTDKTYAIRADGSVVWWGQTSSSGAHRVNGEVYLTPEGYGVSVPAITSILPASSAGFVFSLSYSGRDGTTYAASSTAPTNPGNYRVTATCGDPAFAATKVVDFTIKKGTPTILNKPFPSLITYGQTLASYDLSVGGEASVPGTFAFENPSIAPNAGDSTQNLVFTPTDTEKYDPVTVTMEVRVTKATPVIVSLPTSSTITYGQTLADSVISDGRISVPNWWWLTSTPFLEGNFTFSTPTASLPVGSSTQSVTFTPADSANYNTFTTWVDVVVAKASPAINTSPTASPIVLGQTLASSSLSGGVASVAGTFAWENPNTTPGIGTSAQSFVFTPNDTANYATTTGTVNVSVNKATPVVTLAPTAPSMAFGQTLAQIALSGGGASVPGSFVWTTSATAPAVGTSSQSFTFIPDDTTNYASTTGTVAVTVNKVAVSWTLGNLTAVYDGTAKAASATTSPAGLNVILTYNGEATAPSAAGSYELLAVIDEGDYSGSKSEVFTITPASQTIGAFSAIGDKVYGSGPFEVTPPSASSSLPVALSVKNGPATVSGNMVTLTGVGTVVLAANQAGNTNYNAATEVTTSFAVTKATPVISALPTASLILFGQTLSNATLSGGSASVAGSFAFTNPTTAPIAGTSTHEVTFTPSDASNHHSASANVSVMVGKATPVVTWSTPASITYGAALSGAQLNASASVNGTFDYTPVVGTVVGVGNQTLAVVFTPGDTANYNTMNQTVTLSVTTAAQTIGAFSAIGDKVYGSTSFEVTPPSASSSLPVVLSVKNGPATVSGNMVTLTGVGTVVLAVNQAGNTNYDSATEVTTSFAVTKATPVVTWNTPTAVTYGTALSGAQLNASASVNGTFSYMPVAGTVLGVGNQTLGVVFTPGDDANYNSVNRSVMLSVTKGTQTIGAFAAIGNKTYGASAFAVTPPTTTSGLPVVLSVKTGPATVSGNMVTVTGVGTVVLAANQAGNTNFNAATEVTTSFAVGKATPTISVVPTVGGLTYGRALSNATLSGGSASVAGSFAFTNPATVPGAGTSVQPVTFTPTDGSQYNTASANVSVTVAKATPVLTWNTPAVITYGTALSGAQLNASTSVSGTFNYTPVSGTILGAGNQTLSLVFTPTDTVNYNTVNRSVALAVGKATPVVTWNTPAVITYGTALRGAQLNASASVNGTFNYTPVSGTVVGAGNQTLGVVFTPGDTTNYNSVNSSVTLSVMKGNQTISSFAVIGNKTYGVSAFAVTAPTATGGLPVVFSVKSGPATMSGNMVTITGVGTVVLAANQSGNANFGPASEVTTSFFVSKGSQTIAAFTPVGTRAFGSAFNVNPPTASSGLPVVLTLKSGPAAISANNTVTPTRLGTVVLAANQPGDANYNAALQVTTSFVVVKGNQTISAFATIESKLVGVSPFAVTAPSASSGLPVTLSIKSGPATISSNRTLTITGPGNVTVAANQAGNANFNTAPEVTTTFLVSRPLSTLTIAVPAATEGTVTPGFAGATTREIGANYTVTAIPASGMISKGWRKGNATLSTNATLKFVMEANMQLNPLFAPDFSKLAGIYNGLVGDGEIGSGSAQDMQAFPSKNGFVTFALSNTGGLSGNLSIEGQVSRITGNFSSSRNASISIARANNKTPAQAVMQLIPVLPGEISGHITVSGSSLPFRALRAAYTNGTATHPIGSRAYTLAIPAPSGIGLGHGFARVAIQSNGLATAIGRLATGDAISASAGFVDSGDGKWVMPVYSTGNGIFTGEIVIPKTPSAGTPDLLGNFEWLRAANSSSQVFPTGFLSRTSVVGSRYSLVAQNSLLSGNRTTAGFTLNIDPQRSALATAISQNGTWPSSNVPALTQPISSGLKLTFTSANGSVQGNFNRTINGTQSPTQFQGVMFGKPLSIGVDQRQLRGAGYFISGNQSVPVEITLP